MRGGRYRNLCRNGADVLLTDANAPGYESDRPRRVKADRMVSSVK